MLNRRSFFASIAAALAGARILPALRAPANLFNPTADVAAQYKRTNAITREALSIMKSATEGAYSDAFDQMRGRKLGDTISVRIPPRFVGREGLVYRPEEF
jgi:flagellar basal body L-ring protein FlgH